MSKRVHKTIGAGVVLEYHDAPEDECTSIADAAHALGKLTEQIAGILGCCGRSQYLCEMDAALIRHVWTNALRGTPGGRIQG